MNHEPAGMQDGGRAQSSTAPNRREFLQTSCAAGGIFAAAPLSAHIFGPTLHAQTEPKRLLILGGTNYLGPALVRAAVARGHRVTLFNRGRTRPYLFRGVERRIGDRYPEHDNGLSALEAGNWDAVLDLCAYYPRLVEASARMLHGRVARYIMMSSISVYADFSSPGLHEGSQVRELTGPFTESADLKEDDFGTYGARKAACETLVRQHFEHGHTIVRACGMIGAGIEDDDPSKFYWPARLARPGLIAGPGTGDDPLQVIDVNDVAEFLLLVAERGIGGTFNAVGPEKPLTTRDYVEAARAVVKGPGKLVWLGEELPNTPMWAPAARVPGFARISNRLALRTGLRCRPIAQSIATNYDWFRLNFPANYDFWGNGVGPDPAMEARLLDKKLGRTPA